MSPFSTSKPSSEAFRLGMVGLWLGLACACGRNDSNLSPLGSSDDLTVPGLVAQAPSVSGRVVLLGGPPKLLGQVLDLSGSDCTGASPLLNPAWKMTDAGGLEEVIITVSGSRRASNLAEASPRVDLTQCELKPYVMAVQVGESVSVHNTEQSSARLRLYRHKLGTLNDGEEVAATSDSAPVNEAWVHEFNRPGLYRIEGSTHRWMRSWVWVHEGIHKAVSGQDGRYTVERALPDGEYVVQAWHPRFKKSLSKTVQIVNGTAQVDFAFDYSLSFDAVEALDS